MAVPDSACAPSVPRATGIPIRRVSTSLVSPYARSVRPVPHAALPLIAPGAMSGDAELVPAWQYHTPSLQRGMVGPYARREGGASGPALRLRSHMLGQYRTSCSHMLGQYRTFCSHMLFQYRTPRRQTATYDRCQYWTWRSGRVGR
eukprot:229315-Rhodomonas_salina.1